MPIGEILLLLAPDVLQLPRVHDVTPGASECTLCQERYYLFNLRMSPNSTGPQRASRAPLEACAESTTETLRRCPAGGAALLARQTCDGDGDGAQLDASLQRQQPWGLSRGRTVGACAQDGQTGPQCRVCSLTSEFTVATGNVSVALTWASVC